MLTGRQQHDPLHFEKGLWEQGFEWVAGVDEVGRGCLAGPVVAAAVVLAPGGRLDGVQDSKTLTDLQRRRLDGMIRGHAVSVSIALVAPEEIDRINILRASLKAMALAVDRLSVSPHVLLVDGNQAIPHILPQKTLVKGDQRSVSIGAASIVAKVFRDDLMADFHRHYPHYNFARHKGYATREHLKALAEFGVCPLHRKTFRGVRELVGGES